VKTAPATQAALETIEEVARETLDEIDQLVRALREDDSSDQGGGKVEPPLGLAAVETLVERHRSAGLAVSIRQHGSRQPLSPGLDQAAYRILQGALTNAARHGDGGAEVEIGFGPSSLELAVINRARPDATSAAVGNGIVDMRERATLLGAVLKPERATAASASVRTSPTAVAHEPTAGARSPRRRRRPDACRAQGSALK
jgi:signal transduction histidine kinase